MSDFKKGIKKTTKYISTHDDLPKNRPVEQKDVSTMTNNVLKRIKAQAVLDGTVVEEIKEEKKEE